MRVVFLGHACHLVEVDAVRLLTDPWLVDPIFEGPVEHDVPLGFAPADREDGSTRSIDFSRSGEAGVGGDSGAPPAGLHLVYALQALFP